jgi:hypothetical protein
MIETKPKRRWFRFSLRTFLIIVTLFGGWLGWNFYEVRERDRYFKYLSTHGFDIDTYEGNRTEFPWRVSRLPWMWRLMGSQPQYRIHFREATWFSKSDAKTIGTWFPEADIWFHPANTNLPIEIIQ